MPTVNDKFLREELEAAKEQIERLRKAGKVAPEIDAVFGMLLPLLSLLVTVLLEKTTRKTSRNSSLPPSQMEAQDDTAQRAKPGQRAAQANDQTGPNLQQVITQETLTVESCDSCGADLSQVAASECERRVRYDSVFRVIEHRVEAEVKHCPDCQARSKAQFPANLPGPRQYGSGLQAFIILC